MDSYLKLELTSFTSEGLGVPGLSVLMDLDMLETEGDLDLLTAFKGVDKELGLRKTPGGVILLIKDKA